MKEKMYVVFDLVPTYGESVNDTTVITLTKLETFGTHLDALQYIDQKHVGFGLTIMEVWE